VIKKADQATYRTLIDGVERSTLVHGEKTLMARFRLKKGTELPSHYHLHEQTGLLISGRIVLTVDGEDHEMMPGDSWCIAPDISHSAKALEDAEAVEVFSPVREDYLATSD
jgi:quercetin dioxygenase-like cupin family protein